MNKENKNLPGPARTDIPWLVAAARHDPVSNMAAVGTVYFYPEDAAGSFELDDFDTVKATVELSKSPANENAMLRSAYNTGLAMAKLYAEDQFLIDMAAPLANEITAGPEGLDAFGCGVKVTLAEPDEKTKARLEAVKRLLEADRDRALEAERAIKNKESEG